MSASDKKKLRKEQAVAAMTERQRQEQAEAKKLKIYTISFITGLVLVALIVVTVLGVRAYTQYGIAEKSTIVATVGEHRLNTVEFNYYYNDSINDFYSSYSQYEQYGQSAAEYIMAIEGMDVSLPLNAQIRDEETGATWADFFVETALDTAKSDYALYDKAIAEGFKLSEEEQAEIDSMLTNLDAYATMLGYNNSNQYLRALYGNGASKKTYKAYSERKAIAEAYKQAHEDSIQYEDSAIREYEKDKIDNYNSYDYSYAYMSYTDFRHGGTTDESGNTTYTDAENQAARDAVKLAAEKLASCTTLEEMKEMLHVFEPADMHAEHDHESTETEGLTEDETAAAPSGEESTDELVKINEDSQLAINDFTNTLHTEINAPLAKWLAAAERQEGDIDYIENTTTTKAEDGTETTVVNGYYVVYFKSKTDNKEPLGNVRHLLVQFEGGSEDEETGETVYSEEEKAAAKEEADGYLKTWQEGEQTEASFIELVRAHSDDSSAAEGGLFEDIHPKSEYVVNFRNWAIDPDRKANDAAVIETEYGYHVMYYVGDDEMTYRDYMITNEMRVADQEAWYESVLEPIATEIKNTSKLKLDLVISPAS